jgi:hypothetical protein
MYSGNKIQTSLNKRYRIECEGYKKLPCNSNSKGVVDYEFGTAECGPYAVRQPFCAEPDIDECFVGLNSQNEDPRLTVDWNRKSPNITCTYDAKKMNSFSLIKNFRSMFGETESYNQMMQNLCSGPGTSCANDPITGKPFVQCSKLRSLNEEGDTCREWWNRQIAPVQDSVVINYCLANPNSPDCKCITRVTNDESYRLLKSSSPFNDGCWYVPCVGQSVYLTTSDLRNPSCPDNFCQLIINNLQNRGDINIKDISSGINCDTSTVSPIVPPGSGSGGNNGEKQETALDDVSVILLVSLVGIVGIAIYIASRR